jgi:NAD-dependent dihydropyrimidine dehydrogenase PreA subunit
MISRIEGQEMRKEVKDWTKDELIREYVGKYTPVTIPVNVSIEGRQAILDLSSIEKILKDAKIIAVQDCGCRTRLHKCDAPLDVCLSLDDSAREAIEGGARKISKSQALEVMRRSHESGLVHMTYTVKGQEKPFIICSCCSCCCHSLSALVRFGIPDHVVASEYMASNDLETCNNCGTCVQRCQFRARQLVNDKLEFDQSKCFGCGVCVTTCPTKSIRLVTRKIFPSW